MFTGIVEETSKIRSAQTGGTSGRLDIEADIVIEGTKIGDSIAVNGVCLTVVELGTDGFTADVMPETAERSSLGKCRPGDKVNLERAMAADGRFGGHIVSGHIDGTGACYDVGYFGDVQRPTRYRPRSFFHLIYYRVPITENRFPGVAIRSVKFCDTRWIVQSPFKLPDDNIADVVCIEKRTRRLNRRRCIKIVDVLDPLPNHLCHPL